MAGVKANRISIIIVGFLLVVVTLMFVNSMVTEKERTIAIKDFEDFKATFLKEEGVLDQMGLRLKEEGYENVAAGMFNSNEEIWIKFILTEKEATKQEQKEVKAIFKEMIKEHNYDPKVFKVKVSNNDSPDW